jgi:glycosyltransferase involved in cell wall biosynthesis
LIVPSEHKKQLLKAKAGRDALVIYNGVDAEHRFTPLAARDPDFRSGLGIAADSVVVGQVGALVVHKRPDYLLAAFERARLRWPQLHLCLVGAGPMEEPLRAEIARRGVEACVTLTGFVESTLVFYQQVFDINVMASSNEGLGIAAVEASACGLPSLVTDCTGLKEVVVHGETGYRFAEMDDDALVDYIVELAGDPVRREEMGQRARALALRQFSLTHYHTEIVAVVASML